MNMIKQAGLTLVELLVAMAIGLFLTAGVVTVYININADGRLNDNMSYVQEGARFAFDTLSKDLRMAGYTGCSSRVGDPSDPDTAAQFNNVLAGGDAADFTVGNSIVGWDAPSTAPGDEIDPYDVEQGNDSAASVGLADADGSTTLTTEVVATSDMIRIWGGDGQTIVLERDENDTASASDSAVFATGTVASGRFSVVNDCTRGGIFQNCGSSGFKADASCSPGNTGEPLNLSGEAFVVHLRAALYYVSLPEGQSVPSLYRASLDANGDFGEGQELVAGVESMQILYGVNNDGDAENTPDVYVPASAIASADWINVVSVEVSLLMVSPEDNVAPAPVDYVYNRAEAVTPGDQRIRRVFTKVISLRNRSA